MNMKSLHNIDAWLRRLAMSSLLLLLLSAAGCQTASLPYEPVSLQATGDPGMTFTLKTTLADTPEMQVSAPATLDFSAPKFDLRCVHGPQPGRLSLSLVRSGRSVNTGDTTQPGQVTLFEVRQKTITVRLLPSDSER